MTAATPIRMTFSTGFGAVILTVFLNRTCTGSNHAVTAFAGAFDLSGSRHGITSLTSLQRSFWPELNRQD